MSKTYTYQDYIAAYPADIQGLIGLALGWQRPDGLTAVESILKAAALDNAGLFPLERDQIAANVESLDGWMKYSSVESVPVANRAAYQELKTKLASYVFDPITHAERILSAGSSTWLVAGGVALAAWYFLFRRK